MANLPTYSKRAIVTNPTKDEDNYHVSQVDYMGKVCDVELLTPYGLYSNLPKDGIAVIWNVQGQEENRVGIGNTPSMRFKGLKPGEVVIGSPQTLSQAKFLANGDITITGKKDLSITVTENGSITIEGTLDITTKGDVTLNTEGNVLVDAEGTLDIHADGNLNITSDANIGITASGTFDLTATGAMNIDGSSVDINNGANGAARIGDTIVGALIDTGSSTVTIG